MASTPPLSSALPNHAWLESDDGESWPLIGNFHLGRSPDNDVLIDHPKASRQHAAIHAQDDTEFWLLDLGSRNGTYLNEQRLLHPRLLRDGDKVSVGGRNFTFHQPATPRVGPNAAGNWEHTTTADGLTAIDLRQQKVWLLMADIEKFTQLSHDWEVDKLALGVGTWLRQSRQLIAEHRGRLSRILGDGFLACWDDRSGATKQIVTTIKSFQRLRTESPIKFRIAVHYGVIAFGEQSEMGEESMLGPEMNYIFRLEDLASKLGVTCCVSASANAQLAGLIGTRRIDGEHELKGFANTHQIFEVVEAE
jgi:adenylate cyclase